MSDAPGVWQAPQPVEPVSWEQPDGDVQFEPPQPTETSDQEDIFAFIEEESIDTPIENVTEAAVYEPVSEVLSAPAVEELTPELATTEDSSPVRRRRSGGGVTNLLSWSDVGLIFDFSERFLSLDKESADIFCELFDIPTGSNVTDIAQALYPAGNDSVAFGIVTGIVNMASTGEVIGFGDGIRLVNRIDGLPDATAKAVSRQISALTGVEIKYRKNSQTTEFVVSVFSALDKTRKTGRLEKLEEFQALLDVWPGSKK